MSKSTSTSKQPINGRSSQPTSTSLATSLKASNSNDVISVKRVMNAKNLYNNFLIKLQSQTSLLTEKEEKLVKKLMDGGNKLFHVIMR